MIWTLLPRQEPKLPSMACGPEAPECQANGMPDAARAGRAGAVGVGVSDGEADGDTDGEALGDADGDGLGVGSTTTGAGPLTFMTWRTSRPAPTIAARPMTSLSPAPDVPAVGGAFGDAAACRDATSPRVVSTATPGSSRRAAPALLTPATSVSLPARTDDPSGLRRRYPRAGYAMLCSGTAGAASPRDHRASPKTPDCPVDVQQDVSTWTGGRSGGCSCTGYRPVASS